MGHGIRPAKSGLNVVFCAGTGLLVFLDLVTHVARKMTQQLSEKEESMLNDDFKLIVFVSFQSREEAIALELLESMAELNKKLVNDLFELRSRISTEPECGPRWSD